jgi:EpsI family protein
MPHISRRTLVLSGLMGSASIAAHEARPRTMLVDQKGKLKLADCIPGSLTGWVEDKQTGVVIANPGTEALLSQLYTEVLSRAYVNASGTRVMLSIAYGANQSDDKAVHYPDVCYPAQGFTVGKKEKIDLSLNGHHVPAYGLLATIGPRREHIIYWATVGDKVVLGAVRHKLAQLGYGFNGIVPDGLIFRASVIESEPGKAHAALEDFLRVLHSATAPQHRPRLFGA